MQSTLPWPNAAADFSFARILLRISRVALWALTVLLVLYPLTMIFIGALLPEILNNAPLLGSDLFAERILSAWLNTLRLGVAVGSLSLMIGAALALLVSYGSRSGWVDILMSVPFLTPPFLASLAWTMVVGSNGYLSRLGLPGALLEKGLFSFGGLSLLMAVHYAPIVYFAVRAQIARVSNSLLWAAQVAGASPGTVAIRVLLPLTKPALLAGGFLAFAASIEEYGAPLVIGNRIGFPVVTTEIRRLVSVYPINLALASALGSTLLLLAGAVYLLSLFVQRRSVTATGSSPYPPPQLLSVRARRLLWLLAAAYGLVAVIVPYGSILLTSVMRLVSAGPAVGNLTLQNYAQIFVTGSSGLRGALIVSLALASAAAALGTLVGTGAAREGATLSTLASIPVAIPAIATAVGCIIAWNAPWANVLPIYGTVNIVALFYTAQYLPYAVQYARAGFSAIPSSYEWAGRVHGASAARTMRRILVPLLRPHCLAGAIIIFSISFRELVGSVLLRPPGIHTVSTVILREFDQGSPAAGMAIGVVAITVALIAVMAARKLGAEPRRARF